MPFTPIPPNPDRQNGSQGDHFTPIPPANQQSQSHPPAAMSASSHILSSIANFAKDVPAGFSKTAISGALNTGAMVESGLDETLGRVGNAMAGNGFSPTQTGAHVSEVANQDGLQNKTTGEKVGGALETGVELLVPGEELVDTARKLPAEALKSPIAQKVAGLLGNQGAQATQKATKFAQDAWEIVSPKMTSKVEGAYRDAGAMTKQGAFKGAKPTPIQADKKVLDAVTPLIEDGKLSKGMDTVEQHRVLSMEAKDAHAARSSYVKANNKDIEPSELDAAFNTAKSESKLIFAGDETAERAYDATIEEFKKGLKGNTAADLDAAVSKFGATAKKKFNAFRKDAEGSLNPTDNARVTALRDVYTAARGVVKDAFKEDETYERLLNKESGLITASQRVAQKSAGTEKEGKILEFYKRHPSIGKILGYSAAGLGISAIGGIAGSELVRN